MHIFLSSKTYVIWSLAFVMRWEKSLFFNSFFKSELNKNFLFCFSVYISSSGSQLFKLIFPLCNLWYIKHSFSVDFEKVNWYFLSLFFFLLQSLYCMRSNWFNISKIFWNIFIIRRLSIVSRANWFKYQFYRRHFVTCNHIFDITILLV